MSSSNISNAPEQFLSDFKEALTKYLEQEKDDVSLQKFYKYNPEVFKTHSNQTDLKATINRTFIKMIEEFEIEKYNKKQPKWDDILQERREVNHFPSKRYTTLSKNKEKSVSSSSSETLDILSTEQWEAFEEKYQAMKDEKKWKVGDVYVEDVIYKHAKTLKYENAAHSFILNLADKRWKNVFTEDQLSVIEKESFLPLPTLPRELVEFLKKFKNVENLDDAWKIANDSCFDPVNQFDADCAKQSILSIISAYRWDVVNRIARQGKERDLMRVWRAIDDCFDDLKVDIRRSDQQAYASSARLNEDRSTSIDGSIMRKIVGVKPDLIISKNMLEYGAAEHGYEDETGVGTKELTERYLKFPKTLKDMMLKIGQYLDNDRKALRSLRIIGFSYTHLRMVGLIMDAPCGYVCRIRELKEVTIPCEFERFYTTYIRFIKQIFTLKYIVKESMTIVRHATPGTDDENDDDDENMLPSLLNKSQDTVEIPSCINKHETCTDKKTNKRKDREDDDSYGGH